MRSFPLENVRIGLSNICLSGPGLTNLFHSSRCIRAVFQEALHWFSSSSLGQAYHTIGGYIP